METLELYLSPINAKRLKVIVTKSGETESLLPFFEEENDWRTTVLRCLEVNTFKSEHFDPKEQEWMVKSGILNKNSNAFDAKYLVKIGQEAYQSLFPADSNSKNALLASLRFSEDKNTQLHIQLKFAAEVVQTSRLADYPWELLHDGEKFLLHRHVTISRYIACDSVPPKLPPTDKVNVLLVSSAAWDSELGLQQLGEQETQAIRQGLEKARDAGHINFVELADATKDKLRAYLTEHRGEDAPHILHFDGHGLFGKRCSNPKCRSMYQSNKLEKCRKCDWVLPQPQGYLVFEDADKKADYVSAAELGVLLRQSSLGDGNNKSGGIALVVLSACQSGMALDGDSVFNGTAQNLISHRIPSVVAMQYSVSVVSATKFAEQFYRSLGQKNSLGIAISQAREAMGIEDNQWYRPVLYLRWEDNEGGQLFKDSHESQVYEGTKNPNPIKTVIQAMSIDHSVLPPSPFLKDKELSQEENLQDKLTQKREYLIKALHDATELAIQIYLQEQIKTLERQLKYLSDEKCGLNSSSSPLSLELDDIKLRENYDELRRLLLEKKEWKAADVETMQVMLQIAKKTKEGWLTLKDILNLPSEDLRKIDCLWLEASNRKFGYSVQRNIWLKIQAESKNFDSSINYNPSLFLQFADQVGWRVNNNLLMNYDDFDFSLNAPDGHLPTFRFPSRTDKLGKWRDSFQFFLPRL